MRTAAVFFLFGCFLPLTTYSQYSKSSLASRRFDWTHVGARNGISGDVNPSIRSASSKSHQIGSSSLELLGLEAHESERYLPRSNKPFALFIGLGIVNALHIGTSYQYSIQSSVEVSLGTAFLLELSGKTAKVYAAGYNFYVVPDGGTSPFFSALASVSTLRTTGGHPLGNIYFVSPNFGLDWVLDVGTTFSIRGGPALLFRSPGATSVTFNVGIELGWRY